VARRAGKWFHEAEEKLSVDKLDLEGIKNLAKEIKDHGMKL
jgi:hypothetical protein